MNKTITLLLMAAAIVALPLFHVEAQGRRPVSGVDRGAQPVSRPGMGAAGRPIDGGGVGRAGKPIGAARVIQRTPALGRSYAQPASTYINAQPVYTYPQSTYTDPNNYYGPQN